jgi:glyoxylase-like metal-dependent hydrolase (beta-lactamase superfamily II)
VVPKGGGNTAVFVTAKGVLLVDTKHAENARALLDQIRRVTDKPITHVVNTHSHDDHTGGNDFVPADTQIVAHERTAANIKKMRRQNRMAAPTRPMRTFRDRLTIFDGDDAVDIYHFGAAHTDGDAFVVFRNAGVMHVGDVFTDKAAPVINLPWGGDPATYAATIAKAADVPGVTRVITGHGPVLPVADFRQYGTFIELIIAHVRAAMAAGKDWNQARRELVLPPEFADYRLDRLIVTFHDIYKGLTPWWHVW